MSAFYSQDIWGLPNPPTSLANYDYVSRYRDAGLRDIIRAAGTTRRLRRPLKEFQRRQASASRVEARS